MLTTTGNLQSNLSINKMQFTSIILRSITLLMLFLLLFQVTAHAQLDEVTSLIKEGYYTQAISKLTLLSESTKDLEKLSRYYYQLGEIYYTYTQQYPEALNVFQSILNLKAAGLPIPEIYLAYIKVGDVYCRMGEHNKAIHNYLTLVDISPETHFVNKIGWQRIRDIRTALNDITVQREIIKTYRGSPIEAVAIFQIAELYRNHSQLNQPEKAIETYQELLQKHPTDMLAAEAQWRIAHIRHTVLHQMSLAIESYKKVAEYFPTTNYAAEALFHTANLYRQEEKYTNAINVYVKITDEYPNFWNMHAVYYWSGYCYEKTQNNYGAIKAYKIFLNVYLPTLDPVYLGQISMYDKSVNEVIELIQNKVNTISEELPIREFAKFEMAVEDGNFQKALSIGHDIMLNVSNSQITKSIASQLPSIKHRAAIQKLRSQIHHNMVNTTEIIRAQLHIATIYERELLDYSNAVNAYRKVVEDYPESHFAAEAYYRIGLIYADILEKPNSALKTFNSVIEKHQNSIQAMMATFQVGEIYRRLHRYDEALNAYKITTSYPERELYLSEGYKDSYADRALFRIGRVYFEDKRISESRNAFEEFIKNRPDSPRLAAAHIYLAVINAKNGENKVSVVHYRTAEKLLKENTIQMRMVIDEVESLGFLSEDTILNKIQERKNRLINN